MIKLNDDPYEENLTKHAHSFENSATNLITSE